MADQELLQAIRTIMKEETAPLYTRMDKIDSRMDKMDSRMDKLEREVLEVKATQESIVIPAIQRLAEGHKNILEHIQEKIDARADKIEEQVDALKIAVRYHSQDISELKKAQ